MATDPTVALSPRRWNFSLRWMLVFVAICSLALGVGRQWWVIDRAQDHLMRVRASWQANRVLVDEVRDAMSRLYDAESHAVWIGRREAAARQVERLRELADSIEAKVRVTLGGPQTHNLQMAADLREEAERLSKNK